MNNILLITGIASGLVLTGPALVLAQTEGTKTPTITAHRFEEKIDVDGRLGEAVWSRIPPYKGFVEAEPVEGAKPRNDSEVWVLFDNEALYVGARLYDESPGTIARGLTRRDAAYTGQYDYFTLMLDPNLDRRTGYEFQVSAANAQLDRYLYADNLQDLAWDAVWESAVAVGAQGWTVEIRIPFSQVRYEARNDEQVWGINFIRRRAADSELSSLALESRLASGRVSQFGRLEGIQVAGAPARIEFRPYMLSRARHAPVAEGNPFAGAQNLGGKIGLDLRYGLGSAFTLDATVNPDFGQVEADPAVINLTALETRFEERRPFFIEDAQIFDFILTGTAQPKAFYSRRIGRAPQVQSLAGAEFNQVPDAARIVGAAKLTGRTAGGLSIGALTAVTARETGTAYFASTGRSQPFFAEPQTTYGVFRFRQDLRNAQSMVGGIVTAMHRALPETGELNLLTSGAFLAGFDFEHTWANRRWAFSGHASSAQVRGDPAAITRIQRTSLHYLQRPDREGDALVPGATSMTGGEFQLGLEKRRGRLQGSIRWRQYMPRMEVNDLGFATAPERIEPVLDLEYRQVTPRRFYRNYAVRFASYNAWSHEVLASPLSWDRLSWGRYRSEMRLGGDMTFRNLWSVDSQVVHYRTELSRTETRGGPRMLDPGSFQWTLNLSTDTRRALSFRPSLLWDRGFLDSLNERRLTLRTEIHPSSRLEIRVEPSVYAVTDASQYVTQTRAVPYEPTYGARYLFADLERLDFSIQARVNWIFTPRLSFELFTQPLISAGDYVTYKQLLRSESYDFEDFTEGVFRRVGGTVQCEGGRTCLDAAGRRWVDLDGSGQANFSLSDQDFNIRSQRTTAVVRWEYRPGSIIHFVWQRRQYERAPLGDFNLGRDTRALFGLPADDIFIMKMTFLLTL